MSLADTLGSVTAAAASVVSVAGLILIYTLFLFIEQMYFRRKLAAIFHGDGQEARVSEPCSTALTARSHLHPYQDDARDSDLGVGLCRDVVGRRRLPRASGR